MIKELYTNKGKVVVFSLLLAALVVLFFTPLIPNINIGQYTGNDTWVYVPIPLQNPIMGLLFYGICHFFLKLSFGFSFKKLNYLFIFGWPALLVTLYNVFFITDKSVFNYSIGTGISALLLSFVSALLIGFFEELLFRGAIFNLLLVLLKKNKHNVLLSTILSGIIFGGVHLTNLSWQGRWDTINQVFSAIAVGILFSLIYYYTKNLLIVVLLHAFIDTTDIFFKLMVDQSVGVMTGFDWSTWVFSGLFLLVSWQVYRKITTETPFFIE